MRTKKHNQQKKTIPQYDYMAQSVAWLMSKSYNGRGFEMSIDRRIDDLYRTLKRDYNHKRVYYVTRTTIDRVRNMDTNEVTPEMAMYLCRETSCGTILFAPKSGEAKLSLNYAIREDGIYIDTYVGDFRNLHGYTEGHTNANIIKAFVGSIIITPDGVSATPNNSLELMHKAAQSDNPLLLLRALKVPRYYIEEALKSLEETKGATKEQLNDVPYEKMKVLYPFTAELYRQYTEKMNILRECYKTFLFIHTTDVEKGDYISETPAMCSYRRGKSKFPPGTIIVDSTYDLEINVINPFSVTGHFRMQACGKEMKDHKLIYVDAYMKQGYHRRATKDRVENNKTQDNG